MPPPTINVFLPSTMGWFHPLRLSATLVASFIVFQSAECDNL
jgi:hypothetical protein